MFVDPLEVIPVYQTTFWVFVGAFTTVALAWFALILVGSKEIRGDVWDLVRNWKKR